MALFALFVQERHASAQIPCRYDVEIIQAPPCGFVGPPPTIALGISPIGGYVVGRYQQCDKAFRDEAFVYDTETAVFMRLPRPAGTTSAVASDVNDAGWIVGSYAKTGFGSRGFVYKLHDNEWIELPPQGSTGGSGASAINNSGQVCGSRSLKGAASNGSPFNAFIWSEKNRFTDLGVMNGPNSQAVDITQDGAVCGWTGLRALWPGSRAFMYDNSKLTVLPAVPGGVSSHANGITESRMLTGGGQIDGPDGPLARGFRWVDGQMLDLSPLPEHNCSGAGDVSSSSLTYGTSSNCKTQGSEQVLWFRNKVIRLNDMVNDPDIIRIRRSLGINDGDQLVGDATDNSGHVVAVKLNPVFGPIGDLDQNCITNVNDLRRVILEWGKTNSIADINSDGVVNSNDLVIVLDDWGNES